MGNKAFVGGLAWETTSDSLRDAFSAHGKVTEAVVISDRETGRSRGFGFVTFESSTDCQNAISAMDGQNLDGRALRVNEAENKPRRDGGGGGGGGGGGRGRSNDRW